MSGAGHSSPQGASRSAGPAGQWWPEPGPAPSSMSAGKVKKELDPEDGHLSLDETTKLLQDLQEAQAERGGSRPSSNLSSLSNASDRDQHHLGEARHAPTWAPWGSPQGGSSGLGPVQGRCRPPQGLWSGSCTEGEVWVELSLVNLGVWPEDEAGSMLGRAPAGHVQAMDASVIEEGTLASSCFWS